MTVIAEKERDKIRDLLARELDDSVELLLFTRPRSRLFVPGRPDCETCAETEELLGELADLGGDKLVLAVHNVAADPSVPRAFGVTEVPTVVVRRAPGADAGADEAADVEVGAEAAAEPPPNVRFVGMPSGYEFSTLVADVVDVSKGRTDLAEATRAAVRAIASPVRIEVFVTPT